MKNGVSNELLDKEKATINPGGNLDLPILFIRLLGHQTLGCRQFDKVLLFTMTSPIPSSDSLLCFQQYCYRFLPASISLLIYPIFLQVL